MRQQSEAKRELLNEVIALPEQDATYFPCTWCKGDLVAGDLVIVEDDGDLHAHHFFSADELALRGQL